MGGKCLHVLWRLPSLVLLGGLATADLDAATNLIVDGSFETPPAAGYNPPLTAAQGYYTYAFTAAGTYTVPVTGIAVANQWTVGRLGSGHAGGNANSPRFHWFSMGNRQAYDPAPAGGSNYAVQLNTDAGGTAAGSSATQIYMQQSVMLAAGQQYYLTYQYAGETAAGAGAYTGGLQVQVSGAASAGVVNNTFNSTTYTTGTVSFVASSSEPALIYFADNAPNTPPRPKNRTSFWTTSASCR